MAYPEATPEQAAFFDQHGWIVVKDAIPAAELDALERHCDAILADKPRYAFDWAWDEKESRADRSFRIVQSSPALVWDDIDQQPYRQWLARFGSVLMGKPMEFWYDQFLGKPPGISVPTYWHQDEAYWGRKLNDRGVTCWIPMIDVSVENGCMHFIDGGHRGGVLTHRLVEGLKSDMLTCEVDEARTVVCPIRRGDVTFHHSKTPHMTTPNGSSVWRKAVSNHMQQEGTGGEGDNYPWRVHFNQDTEQLVKPAGDNTPPPLGGRTGM